MPTETEIIRAALRANPEMHNRLREMALSGKIRTMDEVPNDEELTIIAATNHAGITGAQQARCECSAIVWLSPSTQEMLIKRGATPTRIICIACMMQELKKRKEESFAETRPQ